MSCSILADNHLLIALVVNAVRGEASKIMLFPSRIAFSNGELDKGHVEYSGHKQRNKFFKLFATVSTFEFSTCS